MKHTSPRGILRQLRGIAITLAVFAALVFGAYWYQTGSFESAVLIFKRIGSFFWNLAMVG